MQARRGLGSAAGCDWRRAIKTKDEVVPRLLRRGRPRHKRPTVLGC
jgi:hypothetical protein